MSKYTAKVQPTADIRALRWTTTAYSAKSTNVRVNVELLAAAAVSTVQGFQRSNVAMVEGEMGRDLFDFFSTC